MYVLYIHCTFVFETNQLYICRSTVLTAGHRKEALQILTKCHAVLMDDMMAIFDLQAADKTAQLDLIDHLLVEGRLKEAVTYTWKFGLQEHFEMSSVSGDSVGGFMCV